MLLQTLHGRSCKLVYHVRDHLKHLCAKVTPSLHLTKIKTLHFLTSDSVALVTYPPISYMTMNWIDVHVLIDKLAASSFASVKELQFFV